MIYKFITNNLYYLHALRLMKILVAFKFHYILTYVNDSIEYLHYKTR